MPETKIETATTDAGVAEARRLFREYAAWLKVDLSFQDFERELRGLPGDYTGPSGTQHTPVGDTSTPRAGTAGYTPPSSSTG